MSKRLEKYVQRSILSQNKKFIKALANAKDKKKFTIKYTNSEKFKEWCKKLAQKIILESEKETSQSWKIYKRKNPTKKVKVSLDEKELSEMIAREFEVINSIPSHINKSLSTKAGKLLSEQLFKGTKTRKDLLNFLNERGLSNSKLIARTETARMNTMFTEARSKSNGIVAYRWRTSSDQRVRESHQEMNKVVVFWKDVPELDNMTGHAGEYPNCRCQAIPIVYFNDEFQGTNFVKYYEDGEIKKTSLTKFKKIYKDKGGKTN